MTTLKLKSALVSPLEANAIVPDRFIGRTREEIAAMPVFYGNEQARLGDFFTVEEDGSEDVELKGNLIRAKNIAAGMTRGTVTIRGDVGMHLGAGMRGGEIHVHGNAGDWTCAEMRGGILHVRGNAGHALGGAYRGSRYGMNRGLIIVEGDAGNETGALMRRGLIVVTGGVGDFAGSFMIAGSLVVFGNMGIRPGAGLLRGTIATFGKTQLLPTYRYDCCYRPGFLDLIFQDLGRHGLSVPEAFKAGEFLRYSGDCNRLGKGEILVYDQR